MTSPVKGGQSPADSAWGDNRLLARTLLIKSRLYRFFALTFAVIGVIVFIFLYMKHIEGQLFEALRSPSIVAMILIPFLPAFVLSLMAQRLERKFKKLGRPDESAKPEKK